MRLLFKPDLEETLERYRRFHCSPGPGQVLIRVGIPVPDGTRAPKMNEWDWDTQLTEYLDQCIEASETAFEAKRGVRDDSIPVMATSFGIAALSAYVAGEVLPGEATSWTEPVIKDWADLDKLEIDENRVWFRRNVEATRYLSERGRGRFAVEPRTCLGPLDLANALRGNALFTDFYDHPAEVRRLLDFCVEAATAFIKAHQRVVEEVTCGSVPGRILAWGGQWLPGSAFAMSDDAPNLCSPALYRDFGYEYDQRLIHRFGGAFIHTHALGLHMVSEMMQLKGLRVLQISNDPGQPRPVERLEELINSSMACGAALHVACRPDELEYALKVALKGRIILDTSARDAADANEMVRMVRRYSET